MHLYRKLVLCLMSLMLPLGILVVLNVGLIGAAGEHENLTRLTTSIFPKTNNLPAINSDGTKIVFASGISFMYRQGIIGEAFDIWLYDTATMTATRLTTSTGLYRDSLNPDISGDGTKIVFESNTDFLGQGIPVNQREIWLYDTKTMTLTRITTATSEDGGSLTPVISDDGTVIAFTSSGDFLNENPSELQFNGWLYDTKAMTLTRIPDAAISNARLAINGDGTRVVFNRRNRIFDHETNQLQWQTEVWFYDTPTMTITQVTTSVGSGVRQSFGESISDDGTKIVFRSDADFLGQGIPEGQDEIWLYDTTTMTVTRITTAPNSNKYYSAAPDISGNGTRIAFDSNVNFLSSSNDPTFGGLWVYDTATMTFTRLTSASNELSITSKPHISSDGTSVTFASNADFSNAGFLGQGDFYDFKFDIWLYELAAD